MQHPCPPDHEIEKFVRRRINDQNNANLISAKICVTYRQAKSGMMTTGLGAGILEKEEKAVFDSHELHILLRIAKRKFVGQLVVLEHVFIAKKIYLTSILGQQANGMNIGWDLAMQVILMTGTGFSR